MLLFKDYVSEMSAEDIGEGPLHTLTMEGYSREKLGLVGLHISKDINWYCYIIMAVVALFFSED